MHDIAKLIGVLFLAMVVFASLYASEAQTVTAQDLDLGCAIAGTVEVIEAHDKEMRDAFYAFTLFFLGRLSARDDKTNWNKIIMNDLREARKKGISAGLMSRCTVIFHHVVNGEKLPSP